MILKLIEAQAINVNITQSDLNAFEQSVRALTHNNFQDFNVRGYELTLTGYTITMARGSTKGLRVGDTIEVNDTKYNNGLYVVKTLTPTGIEVEETTISFIKNEVHEPFIDETCEEGIVTKVAYPADIITGVKKLIEYDVKMGGKAGIKSETISRMSVTYYDVNSTENVDGYPAALLSFLKKYKKMRW